MKHFILNTFTIFILCLPVALLANDNDLSQLKKGNRIKVQTEISYEKYRFDHFIGDSIMVVRYHKKYFQIPVQSIKDVKVDKRGFKPGMKVGRTIGEVVGLISGYGFALATGSDGEFASTIGSLTIGQVLSLPGGLIGLLFPHWVEI